MEILDMIRKLNPVQRNTFLASFLGWTLDAFDYFILPLTVDAVAQEFHATVPEVLVAVTLTLAFRPVGAFLFGAIADRYGRRVPLMIDIMLFSVIELASGFAPNLLSFIILRSIFGIAMGGEWGLGAALALESLPAESRGFFSGFLQQGYAVGFLLASVVFGLLFSHIGWRGMFIIGSLPAFLVLFIRSKVPESLAWQQATHEKVSINIFGFFGQLGKRWQLFAYAILLMTAFNCMSHGTQDNYKLLLQQHGLTKSAIASALIIANIGAIVGGTLFGSFSQKLGRRKTIIAAAVIGLVVAPFWANAQGFVGIALAGFAMQFAVQGAWGIIPVHLNELSPGDLRASFPGLSYQLGNLIASGAAQYEAYLANGPYQLANGDGDYAKALLQFMCIVLVMVAAITALGPEHRNADFFQPTQE